jgi:hypothetical protein
MEAVDILTEAVRLRDPDQIYVYVVHTGGGRYKIRKLGRTLWSIETPSSNAPIICHDIKCIGDVFAPTLIEMIERTWTLPGQHTNAFQLYPERT